VRVVRPIAPIQISAVHHIRSLSQTQLLEYLLHVAPVRPVFVWGAPGIGKSALVQLFARSVGFPCVSLLGSQLAPEDLIGVPEIVGGKSRFCPPTMIARDEPYCLFLDELNASSAEVQKAFYSLIHERRIGEYEMPAGSVIIGAGNRAQDHAIVKPMPSALINRMAHVQLRVDHRDWLRWAYGAGLHPWVTEYVESRPDHLWSRPPATEQPFSTPRSWHILSDQLRELGEAAAEEWIAVAASSCLTPEHASQFRGFVQTVRNRYGVSDLLKGTLRWPDTPAERDVLYYLAHAFRAQLVKELPAEREAVSPAQREQAHRAKALIKELSSVNFEIAQMIMASPEGQEPWPGWFLAEVVRDLPRLVQQNDGA